jgi:hypothetical protein
MLAPSLVGGNVDSIFLQIAGRVKRALRGCYLTTKGLQISVTNLTDKQALFVQHYVENGEVGKSALAAGYLHEESGWAALRSPAVQRAVADYRARMIGTEGASTAYRTLMALMKPEQPPMVRLGAAKAMMSAAGIATAPAEKPHEKPLNEMTESELRAFMARMDKAIAEGGEAPVIVVVPDDNAPTSGTTD